MNSNPKPYKDCQMNSNPVAPGSNQALSFKKGVLRIFKTRFRGGQVSLAHTRKLE
jgi:hypothetical protein